MKLSQYTSLAIIVVAAILAVAGIKSFIEFLFSVLYGWRFFESTLIFALLFPILYCIAAFLLIRFNREISRYISQYAEKDITLSINLNSRVVLQTILISISVYAILFNLAAVIYFIVDWFRRESGNGIGSIFEKPAPGYAEVSINAMTIVLSIILIIYSSALSQKLLGTPEDDFIIETPPEKSDDVPK